MKQEHDSDMSRKNILFSISILLVLTTGISESRSCNSEGTSYICADISRREDLLFSLPIFVQKVTLIGTKHIAEAFSNSLFQDISWTNVSELSLHRFTRIRSINKAFLNGLNNLRFLSISECYNLQDIDPAIFDSTPDLETLHLDGDVRLRLSVVENVLKQKVNKLKNLSLQQLQTEVNEASVIGKNFVNALQGKKLIYLDVSYANIAGIYLNDTLHDALYNVKYVDISHSKLPCFSIMRSGIFSSLPNLEAADFSGCQIYATNPRVNTVNIRKCNIPAQLKYLFLENIILSQGEIRVQYEEQYTDCSYCNRLEVLDFSNNRLVHFNLTITAVECFLGLVKLNLSKNGMEYISPSVLRSFSALKVLDISENRLYKMQHMEDFNNLLRKNSMLEVVYLRKNQLSFIPNSFLISNTKLLLLDLSDNAINEISINFSHIINLKIIDIGKNQLGGLTSSMYQTLERLYTYQANENGSYLGFLDNNLLLQSLDKKSIKERYKSGNNLNVSLCLDVKCKTIPQYLTIDLSENPIECRCENEGFLKWAVNTKIRFINGESLVCKYGYMNSLLDKKLHQSVAFDCLLPVSVVKGISTTVSAIVIVSIVILVVRKIRLNRRKVKNIEYLAKAIRNGHHNFSYLAFIPYCSHDYDVVENIILPALSTSLRKTLNTDKEVLCTGMENFIPGMLIIDEIHRCIDECLVVVPIITSAFIQSQWSQTECSVAIQKHRQVLILMEKETNISQAGTTLTNLIENYTRATWSNKEGYFVIHPPLDLVCDRIITVAAEILKKQKEYRRQRPGNLIPLLEKN